MQLKSLAKTTSALNNITAILNNTTLTYTESTAALTAIGKAYTSETLKAALAHSTLDKAQIKAILSANGLQGELLETTADEVANAASTNMVAASQAGATASTLGLGTAFEGLAISLGMSTAALGVFVAAIAAVAVAAVAYNAYQKHLEEVRKETENATQAYSDSSDSIDEYIQKYKSLRQELLSVRGNEEETYRVKKQLLELQKELNDKYGDEYGRLNLVTDAYKDQTKAIEAFNRQTAQTYLNENEEGIRNASDQMAEQRHYNLSYTGVASATDKGNALKEIAKKYEEQGIKILSEDNGAFFSVHLNADAQSAYDTINSFETDIRKKAQELGDEHMFDDILEISSSELMQAKKVIDDNAEIFRKSLIAGIAADDNKPMVYQNALNAVDEYNNAVLNSKDPFNDQAVSSAKEKLESLKNEVSGYIQNDTDGWQKYSSVMDNVFDQADTRILDFNEKFQNDSTLKKLAQNLNGMTNVDLQSLNPGENAFFDKLKEQAQASSVEVSELIDLLTRLGYVRDIMPSAAFGTEDVPSISSTIDKLNTQLKPAFDAVQSAWQKIFTDDGFMPGNVDLPMLNSIKSAIDDLNKNKELGISIDYSSFDNLSKALTDVNTTEQQAKEALNCLVTEIFNASTATDGMTEETVQLIEQMLKSMGVVNAEEVALNALSDAKARAVIDSYNLFDASEENIASMLNEAQAAGITEEQIFKLAAAEQVFNNSDLNPKEKIEKLKELATAYGQTAIAAHIANMEQASAEGHMTIDYEKELASIQNAINKSVNSVSIDFSPVGDTRTKTSPSGTGKDSHLEEYRQKLEELQTMLDRELINEKEFYDQSNTLLNDYLKDTPAHLQKYADEISNAEKTLRGNWISSFGYEKSQLEKDLSDSTLVQWQYYERLSELAELYYNTEGASYGKFADEYEEITQEIKDGQEKLWDDIFSEVNSQIDGLQSACETVRDAVAEYSENGSLSIDTMQKLIALEPQYMAMLFDENGQLQLNAQAYERLAKTKLEELKIDLAGQALNTINSLQSEAQAVEMLTGKYAELRDTGAGAIEQQLQDAVAEAYGRGEQQGKAAEMVLQAYVNQKKVLDAADLSSLSITAEQKDSDADRFLKTFDWIGTLLKKISDSTSKLIDKADRFYNWQKKNSMINRAVKSASREISQNELAYQTYMKKANSVGLGLNYVRKVQDGTLSVEDVTDENTANKIEKYQEWYDKAQACLDTVEDLYDRQRDLIRQKLDNVLEYYSSMDSYLSSITSKIESIISLNDGMGKRTSLTELVEQFAAVSDRLENARAKNTAAAGITDQKTQEDSFGGSKKVAEANERDRKELADTIQTEIDDLDVKKTGNYKKLRDKIADTQSEIDRYRNNGWDKSKAKSYEKLQKELKDYYDLQKALDENATSDTIANYEKIYTKYQKLQNKINSGKTLSESEQKRYDSYAGQLDGLKARGQSALDSLRTELAEAEGTAPKQSEAERIQGEIDGIQSDLEDTATYQNLKRNIEVTESSLAELDEAGYDNLPQKQKKAYDKMKKQLGDYYAQKKALDEGATASNIAEYNKTYLEWKKLQDKLDNGKNLTQSQWKQYNNYTKQLENFRNEKSDTMDGLKAALEEAKNPSDRLEQIEKTFEESSKGMRDSYLAQIDSINGEAENSQQYQNLKAKAQNLEQKKKDKGLSPSEQAKLDKYNAELNALETGATGANIKDYMKTWESWYTLEQKRNKNGKLSDSDAKKYDGYKAKLDAWNDEKQTQINDLLSLMEDDLEQLNKTYSENVSEAESEINDYYANLYSLAKQIAEYNVSSLQEQLTYLESCISYYKELVSLYDSFDGDKLVKILKDLGEISAGDEISSRQDLYSGYLDKLQEKYDTTLSQINEYSQLLKALETGDFESSMGIFSKAMEDYRAEGNTEMADKMQSVLDLLNERASGADDWDEYADEWKNEWEEALSSVKQDLIGTAEEIQEINDALREIRFEHITDAIAELDRASGMLSSIESLIQDDWLFEPDGSLSEYGRAKAALLVSQLEDAQAQADAYLNLYNEIQDSKDTYASDKEYREASNDALQNYYDSLNSAASLENSITDLMKKNAEAEINSLKDIIEARKQALQSKKEYYDYDKSIKNSQKEIDSLKAQIDALENLSDATDAATKAKLAQLKAELEEKEDALQETKDEHTFNLQIDALDEFSNSLTDALDSSAKSVEEILKEQKEIVESAKELSKASADSTNKTLDLLTSFYSGMGISIDGTDLIPPTTETADGGTPNTGTAIPDLNPDNNENLLVSAINKTTDTTEQFRQETIDRFTKLLEEHGLLPEMISAAFPWENVIMPRLNEGIDRLNEFIQTKEDAQSVVINNHYDSLINVEGNIDKHVAKLLPEQLQQCYKYTTAQIYNDIHRIGSRKNAANAINTLVT